MEDQLSSFEMRLQGRTRRCSTSPANTTLASKSRKQKMMKFAKQGAGGSTLSPRRGLACCSYYVRTQNSRIGKNVKCAHHSRRPRSRPHAADKVVSRSSRAWAHLDLLPGPFHLDSFSLPIHPRPCYGQRSQNENHARQELC